MDQYKFNLTWLHFNTDGRFKMFLSFFKLEIFCSIISHINIFDYWNKSITNKVIQEKFRSRFIIPWFWAWHGLIITSCILIRGISILKRLYISSCSPHSIKILPKLKPLIIETDVCTGVILTKAFEASINLAHSNWKL